MVDQVSVHLFNILTFWLVPGSAQVEEHTSKSVFFTGVSFAHMFTHSYFLLTTVVTYKTSSGEKLCYVHMKCILHFQFFSWF